MKVKPKSKDTLEGWNFTHQDQKQVGVAELVKLSEGKVAEIPDPATSTGVRLSFIDFVEPVSAEKKEKKG